MQKQSPEVFCKKRCSQNFRKNTGKHLCQSLPATSLKKRPWHRCFLVNFAKFLKTLFYRTPVDDCLRMVFLDYSWMEDPFRSSSYHPSNNKKQLERLQKNIQFQLPALSLFLIAAFRGEKPSGLKRYIRIKRFRCSTGLDEPTSLRGSRLALGRNKYQKAVINIGLVRLCSLFSKLALGQPSSR